MPSYRKVVEDVEYNTLPSPTKEGFAAAVASNKSTKVPRAGGSGYNGNSRSSKTNRFINKTLFNGNNSTGGKVANGKDKKQCSGSSSIDSSTANSQQEVIEIESDEESTSLNTLAKSNRTKSATEAAIKSGQINGITSSDSAPSSSKSSSAASTQPAQFPTAANGSRTVAAPQTQQPYFTNPLVRNYANIIVNNIHTSLQQTMPTPYFLNGPAAQIRGMERWSEHRIDSATSIKDLEAIRRRLLTLTNRVDLRLKEMNFLKAIGMTENTDPEDASKSDHEITSGMILKLLKYAESNMSLESNSDGNTPKRKRTEDKSDSEQSTKRQRSFCCPFCLNANTPSDKDEVCTCSICDEKSNICSQCRGFCIKCNRLACEDCLMRCDTCFSDTYCTDCMPKSGQCAKCSRKKTNYTQTARYNTGNTIRALTYTKMPMTAIASGRNISSIQPLRITKTAGNLTPPQTAVSYSMHRYIITEKEALGLSIKEVEGGINVQRVHKNSLGEMIGIKDNDEICIAFNNCSSAVSLYETFIDGAKSRPMIFEVKRKIEVNKLVIGRALHRFHITQQGLLGMTLKKMTLNGLHCSVIDSVKEDKLAHLYGLCVGDIICKPFTQGASIGGIHSWFMGGVTQRPFVFDVLRNPSICPPNTALSTITPPLKSTENPFNWTFGNHSEITRL